MDKMKIVFEDGEEFLLPDISSDKFDQLLWEEGGNDLAYDRYIRNNGMRNLSDFNSDGIKDLILVVEQSYRERLLKFKCIHDSDNPDNNWTEINSESDLPKENGEYYCYHKQLYMSERGFYVNGIYTNKGEWGEYDSESLDQSDVTHYQKKPNRPDPPTL